MPDNTKPDHAAALKQPPNWENRLGAWKDINEWGRNLSRCYLARDEQYKQAVKDVRVALEALKDIYQCMGGDDSAAKGWNAPEDVWEIALDAITAIRARYPEPDDAR